MTRIKRVPLLVIFAAALFSAAFFLAFSFFQRGCRLLYTVGDPSYDDMTLRVTLDISNVKRLGETVYLTVQNTRIFDIEAICGNGAMPFRLDSGTLSFAPASGAVSISYSIQLGIEEKHGKNGVCYPDLIAFAGDQAFILPEQLMDATDEQISRLVSRITVNFDLPSLTWIIPFEINSSVIVDKPDWFKIYDFSKSAYVFGDFTKYPIPGGNIFIEAPDHADGEMLRKAGALIGEYRRLYGESQGSTPDIVMLRSSRGEILGGAGIHSICSTFDSGKPRDWQLLSHRLGHSFFDSAVTVKNFHFKPTLWFYEGLITYYETVSMDAIGYSPEDIFSEMAGRYYYMRLKDPLVLSVTPMNEKELILGGQLEFLHYSYAPLIYKALNGQLPGDDGILSFILSNAVNQDMDVNYIMRSLFDIQIPGVVKDSVYGCEVIDAGFTGTIPGSQMLEALRDYEKLLWTWFRQDFLNYPLDEIDASFASRAADEAKRRRLAFADEDTALKIESFSTTVYELLMEYTLRADVCGVSLTDLDLRYKLLADESNVNKWKNFIKESAGQ